jgi:hypothetical protein
MWCPSCGDEFREGFTTCGDCGVALVHEQPARRARRLPLRRDQYVEFDLSGWPDARREALDAWIFADNIDAAWEEDGILLAARNRAPEIDDLIALLDAEAAASAAAAEDASSLPGSGGQDPENGGENDGR